MPIEYIYPEYEVLRNTDRCIACRVCERQCANEVHRYDPDLKLMLADDSKCVNCHRCVALCPTRALKIIKSDHTFKENANWSGRAISEIYRQAESGGVLLSSMGNPNPLPFYWDRILINASQVTNPSIDPLREPMETKTFLGQKPEKIKRDTSGRIVTETTPQLELSVPIMFSAMSYGSISYNAHESLARAATKLGILYNTGEGGLHEDFYQYGKNTIVQVASGRFGVHKDYLEAGAAIEIKMGQGAKPGIGGHLPGEKITEDVARARMIPVGTDAISPAPHHDIYSIEDLRQLVLSLKTATGYRKPVIVKIAAVHNVAAIASGIARSGADIIAIDGFRGGTGAALIALGCHLCRSCQAGKCNWGIATQRPELVKRLNPDVGCERLVNLVTAWKHEIEEMMGGMGINSIEALRGNRLMLRGVGLNEKELAILGIKHAGE